MIFRRNLILSICVILLLNNCAGIFVNAYPNANEVTDATLLPPLPNTTSQTIIDSEYKVNVQFNGKIRHVESGEYEMRNGRQVFVVRGLFQYFQDNILITRPYVFDSHGYHELQNEVGIRGEEFDTACDLSAGQYCIDPKLLQLLVG